MPPSTRAKNAHQHPGHILLADMKKRRTKAEIAADSKKKEFDKATTEAALHQLHQFIATEEDRLAEGELDVHVKKNAPPVRPRPLHRQNACVMWDSENECEADTDPKQRK
jgi:hypothetical protein